MSDEPEKTVPLTVYIRDGHLVDREEGGERHVIGKATLKGKTVEMILDPLIPDLVIDAIAGEPSSALFSIGTSLEGELGVTWKVPKEERLWDWHKQP